jgi:hypothetical protein
MKRMLQKSTICATVLAALVAATTTPAHAGSPPAPDRAAGIDIKPGLFVNNGLTWSTAASQTRGDRSVVRRTTGGNPGITASGPTGSVFHPTLGVSKYLFFGSHNHLLILESQSQAAQVRHTVTHVNFTTTPPRETHVLTATASSASVPPPRVQHSQDTGDAFLAYGSDGTKLVGIGISRSDTGESLCASEPMNQLNVQLVADATTTQVRIKDGGRVLKACPKPASPPGGGGIDIAEGLFINNGFFWSTAPSETRGDRSVVRRTTGPNPGISVTGPTGSVFHATFGVSKYLFYGGKNHLLILESRAQAARVDHTVTHVNFTTTPPRETLIMTVTASSAAVSPPRVQFSQGSGDAVFVFGSDGNQLRGIGINRSDNGQFLCETPPISQLNVQLVADATATQVRIKDGGQVITACTKPTQ